MSSQKERLLVLLLDPSEIKEELPELGLVVSTIPVIGETYETMIFKAADGAPLPEFQNTYRTPEEAVEGHIEVVNALRRSVRGESPRPKEEEDEYEN